MGEMRDSDWSREILLRSDWLGPYRSHVYYSHPTMYRKDQLRFNPSGVSGTGMTSLDAGGAHEVARRISSISRIKSSSGTGNCGSRCNSEHKIEGMNRGLAVSDVSSGWCLRLGPLISRD